MQKNRPSPAPVAMVTGAAKRIGAEIARALHAAGMNIVLHYNTSQQEASMLCATLNEEREHSAILLQADLLEIKQFNTLLEQAAAAWGRLDVLVNNASRFYRTPLGKITEAEWDDLLNTNVKSIFFLSQAAAPYLAEQNGCIINIADIHGDRPMHDHAVYCISKAGLVMLTKSLAKELAPAIRVNAVSPTMISPEGDNAVTDKIKKKVIERIALGRLGDEEDIAKAVLFLAKEANYITGQILAVDGGRSLII